MFRVIFEQHVKPGEEADFIARWQENSDVVQTYPGALGSRLFRSLGKPAILHAMADWESKDARIAATEAILTRTDAETILHSHEAHVTHTVIVGEYELAGQSLPPIE